MFFSFYSGANPNAQTTETDEMKVKAAERMQARETAKKDARQKAIEKFQEIQSAKAAEKAKEAERQKKAQKLPSPQPKAATPVSAIKTNKMNSFEADLGHSTNPFDENDFSFSSEDGANPFLDDIRAASAAASALSFGGNPFEETTNIGEINYLSLVFNHFLIERAHQPRSQNFSLELVLGTSLRAHELMTCPFLPFS